MNALQRESTNNSTSTYGGGLGQPSQQGSGGTNEASAPAGDDLLALIRAVRLM